MAEYIRLAERVKLACDLITMLAIRRQINRGHERERNAHPLIIRKSFSDMNGTSSRPSWMAFVSE